MTKIELVPLKDVDEIAEKRSRLKLKFEQLQKELEVLEKEMSELEKL